MILDDTAIQSRRFFAEIWSYGSLNLFFAWHSLPRPPMVDPPFLFSFDQLAVVWNSAVLPCLLLFVSFISLEWYLRRRWGLV